MSLGRGVKVLQQKYSTEVAFACQGVILVRERLERKKMKTEVENFKRP